MKEMQELLTGFLGRKDTLEEEMAIHSNIFAWRIPCTEETARLLFMVLRRV